VQQLSAGQLILVAMSAVFLLFYLLGRLKSRGIASSGILSGNFRGQDAQVFEEIWKLREGKTSQPAN
jgi:hypothetical protein